MANIIINTAKRLLPTKLKKVLKKIIQGDIIVYHNSEWVTKHSTGYEKELRRNTNQKISTNISRRKQLPLASLAKDCFIEKTLKSGVYTLNNLLVLHNPYGLAPLTALALFYTKKPYMVRATVQGDTKEDDVVSTTNFAYYHRVPIFGLYPHRENQVLLEIINQKDKVIKKIALKITTQDLPDHIEEMVEVKKKTETSAFNLTFVYGGDTLYPYAFDNSGVIRYYLKRTPKAYGLFPMSKGIFLFSENNISVPTYSNPHATQALEMDLFGRIYNVLHVKKGLHHDAQEMEPGGNIIAAASSLEGYNEDAVIEIDRKTGKVVKELDLGDIITDDTYKDTVDWAHINTVSYDEKNHSVLVCLRNLHTVINIDWDNLTLKWMIGDPTFWEETSMKDFLLRPVGDVSWFYQAHAAYMLTGDIDGNPDTKHMIIYDNHWDKRRPAKNFDGDINSYVKIYTLNEKQGTVELNKSFPSWKSKIRSNGIYVEDKNRLFVMSGYLEPPMDEMEGLIYEYDFKSGELLNHYATVNSFYRAYEFWPDYSELSKPMPLYKDYILGELYEPVRVETPDLEDALLQPESQADEKVERARKRVRKELRQKMYKQENKKKKKTEIEAEREKNIANVSMYISENYLYLRAMDHLVSHVYFVGKEYTFMQDYSMTTQKAPSLFASSVYYIAIPLAPLEKDQYEIYIKCFDQLYYTEKYIEIK